MLIGINICMEDSGNSGYIYCLHNPAFTKAYGENIYKFGLTREPVARLAQYTTSYIEESKFVMVSEYLKNCEAAEKMLFQILRYSRVSDKREFFYCRPDLVPEIFSEIEKRVNGAEKIEVPHTDYSWQKIGVQAHMNQFLRTECVLKSSSFTPLDRLYGNYKLWCKRRKCSSLKNFEGIQKELETFFDLHFATEDRGVIVKGVELQSHQTLLSEYMELTWHFGGNGKMEYQTVMKKYSEWCVKECTNENEELFLELLEGKGVKISNENTYGFVPLLGTTRYFIGITPIVQPKETFTSYSNDHIEQGKYWTTKVRRVHSHYTDWCKERGYKDICNLDEMKLELSKKKSIQIKDDIVYGIKIKGTKDLSEYIIDYVKDNLIINKSFSHKESDIVSDYNNWCIDHSILNVNKDILKDYLCKYMNYKLEDRGKTSWFIGFTHKKYSEDFETLKKCLLAKKKGKENERPKKLGELRTFTDNALTINVLQHLVQYTKEGKNSSEFTITMYPKI